MTEDRTDAEVSEPAVPPLAEQFLEAPVSPGSYSGDLDLLRLFRVVIGHRRLVLGVPLIVALLTAVYSLVVPPTFTATTTFVPEARSQGRLPSGLTGLAGQFGISLGPEASQSPRFYAEVVKSRQIMERVLQTKYQDPRRPGNPGDSATLLQVLDQGGESYSDYLDKATKRLDELVSARVDNQTNIVRLSVDSRYPRLAAAVANRFVEYLNEFNAKSRQSQARARRIFVEGRIAEGERDLRSAEEELKTFYERNRSWQQAPQLLFEEGRLRRQVQIRQEVYLSLKREYDMARIEEVNDSPVITVIDPASVPQQRSTPRRKLLVLVAIVLGGMGGVFSAFGAEYLDRMRRESPTDYREFKDLIQRSRFWTRRALRKASGRGPR